MASMGAEDRLTLLAGMAVDDRAAVLACMAQEEITMNRYVHNQIDVRRMHEPITREDDMAEKVY